MGKKIKGPILKLKGSREVFSDLITLKTGKINRKATMRELKTNLEMWMSNPDFEEFRESLLDLAIVAKVNKQRMKNQDVDNIAKIVLDALRKNDKFDFKKDVFLFKDDSQVVRLLVCKILKEEDEFHNTDGLIISFRKHDPKKQMILVEM